MNNIIPSPKGYWLRPSGNVGQEIISPRGRIIAWTTDPVFGSFICRVCNDILTDDVPMEPIFGKEADHDK